MFHYLIFGFLTLSIVINGQILPNYNLTDDEINFVANSEQNKVAFIYLSIFII